MFELLAALIVLFLCIWGLVDLLHGIKLCFLRPKKRGKTVAVVFLNEPYAADQINYIAARFRWLGDSYANHFVFTGKDLTDQTKQLCRNISEMSGNISFCDSVTLLHIFDGFYEEINGKQGRNTSS